VLPAGGRIAVLQIFLSAKPSFEITIGRIALVIILLQLLANGSKLGLLLSKPDPILNSAAVSSTTEKLTFS
jgi:hypothetical protein